jgi:hypothetical protein
VDTESEEEAGSEQTEQSEEDHVGAGVECQSITHSHKRSTSLRGGVPALRVMIARPIATKTHVSGLGLDRTAHCHGHSREKAYNSGPRFLLFK